MSDRERTSAGSADEGGGAAFPQRGEASRRVAALCAVGVWAAFIFFMSAHTGSDLSTGALAAVKQWAEGLLNSVFGYHQDPFSPLCHFAEYLVLGALLANALGAQRSRACAFALALALASVYGATDEIHQLFVPGRMCDPLDWAVDTAGAAAGAAAMVLAACLRASRHHAPSGPGAAHTDGGAPIGQGKNS